MMSFLQFLEEEVTPEMHSKFASMSPFDFDQSQSGWRSFNTTTPEGASDAYRAIKVRMRQKNISSDFKSSMLFHAAQLSSIAGNNNLGARILQRPSVKAQIDPNTPWKDRRHGLAWNNYVDATRAFMAGDRESLQKTSELSKSYPKEANRKIIGNLRKGLERRDSYLTSYMKK